MVDTIPNQTRIVFSSAGATRRHVTPLPAVQIAYHSLITALAQETPNHIVGYAADRFDIMARADHLKAVLAAVHAYAQVVVRDIAHFSPVNITDETGFISDAAHEINGALMKAVDQIIEDAAVAAE